MIWYIIARENVDDDFSVDNPQTGNVVLVDLSGTDRKTGIRSNIVSIFDSFGTYPSEIAIDLLKLSMVVFTADKSADRSQAFNKWSRYIHLYQPVSNLDSWNKVKVIIEKTLDFLTGDHWEIHFRHARNNRPFSDRQSQVKIPDLAYQPTTISLLSGGLDSFSGAIDLLETIQDRIVFVSHYSRGGITKTVQDRIYSLLRRYYPDRFDSLQFFVQPAEGNIGEIESSQRSRSFLFLSLGVAVASTKNVHMPIHVYENGLLSLNVPLTANRSGGLSTRTTHPYFLLMYQNILDSLGILTSITTPFRFLTKGEILQSTKNPGLLHEGVKDTHSCSHSTYVRFKSKSMDNHCGYCLPCIVRRAATAYAGLDDVNYVVDVLKNDLPSNKVEGKDLYAIKIALRRLDTMSTSLLSQVRTAGPLQGTEEEISQYVDVYRRGMGELKRLLG
jgi:hypothetical protein